MGEWEWILGAGMICRVLIWRDESEAAFVCSRVDELAGDGKDG